MSYSNQDYPSQFWSFTKTIFLFMFYHTNQKKLLHGILDDYGMKRECNVCLMYDKVWRMYNIRTTGLYDTTGIDVKYNNPCWLHPIAQQNSKVLNNVAVKGCNLRIYLDQTTPDKNLLTCTNILGFWFCSYNCWNEKWNSQANKECCHCQLFRPKTGTKERRKEV